MIIINQLKIRPGYSENELKKKIAATLKILNDDLIEYHIDRQSIDARKKPDIFFILNVICEVKHEDSVLKRVNDINVHKYEEHCYEFKVSGDNTLENRPVIIGAGPAGLFAAYFLAKYGYKPIVLERGYDVDTRSADVEEFWRSNRLLRNSNVLFGEGGAGTFSDGKLNTLVKDKFGRNKEVLKLFVEFGANPSILYEAKPHIGTDVLKVVIKNMREKIKEYGGEFRFNAEVTDIILKNDTVNKVRINNMIDLDANVIVLAIGHSARDTFEMLYNKGLYMEQKDFAVGVRVEHKQSMIDKELYSDDEEMLRYLKHASYKLTYTSSNNRGVYSFCMCPGGFVVNASSEPNRLCINGMSYSDRSGDNANSAIVVTVGKEDFKSEHPLAGIEFQRKLEEKAYEIGNGSIPVQFFSEFKSDVLGNDLLDDMDFNKILNVTPQTKGAYTKAKVSEIFSEEISKSLIEGIEYFDRIIPGFADDYTLLSAVESRTSSPVRITRNDCFESITYKGIYPCGEGAGYAGGITSAAMDGIKIAEQIARVYKPM